MVTISLILDEENNMDNYLESFGKQTEENKTDDAINNSEALRQFVLLEIKIP